MMIKAFLAGIFLPSIVLPLALFFGTDLGFSQFTTTPFIHYVPIFWGIWNILYFTLFREYLPTDKNIRSLLTGGTLGLILALFAVFYFNVPTELGIPATYSYWPLVIAPIVYAILWRLVVTPLNEYLGIEGSATYGKS